MCHELRSPLQICKLGLSMIERDLVQTPLFDRTSAAVSNGQLTDTARETARACDVVVELINDALSADKIESGQFSIERVEVDLVPFIETSMKPYYVQVVYLHFLLH